MEFDPKCFFENPPRMQESVKHYFKKLAHDILSSLILTARTLGIEKLTEHNVKLLLLQIGNDTMIVYEPKHGLMTQLNNVRQICKIICKAIDNIDTKDKYSNLDKKIVKSVTTILNDYCIKASNGGKLALATVVSEICGVCIQSSEASRTEKTLTLDIVENNAFLYHSTNNVTYINDTLFRFITYVMPDNKLPIPKVVPPLRKASAVDEPKQDFEQFKKPKPVKRTPNDAIDKEKKPIVSILKKQVKFETTTLPQPPPRPRTPDVCFWED